jgi:hypothetical protein
MTAGAKTRGSVEPHENHNERRKSLKSHAAEMKVITSQTSLDNMFWNGV